MALQLTVQTNAAPLAAWLSVTVRKQIAFAAAQALNDTVQDCRASVPAAMSQVFAHPVKRTLTSLRYQKATKKTLQASVWINDDPSKGIAPAQYLAPEILGGARRNKRFERALQARGLLPSGMYAVPADGAPKDSNGNVPGSFYVRLLSYLQAFGEQGYRANMTAAKRAKLARAGRSTRGFTTIRGVRYFIGGKGQAKHLAPGIYQKTGIHGSNITPVFLFVRHVEYAKRFDFEGVIQRTVDANFHQHMATRFAAAMRTAR